MIWDFTCCDTTCESYRKISAKKASSAAELREDQKAKHYKDLTNYLCPFGAWGSQGLKLIKEIGRKICDVTGEKRSTFYLLQNISMAIQRGNAACIVGTVPVSEGLEEVFDFVENTSEN